MRSHIKILLLASLFVASGYCSPFLNLIDEPRFSFLKNRSSITQALPEFQGIEVENLQILNKEGMSSFDDQRTSCQVVHIVHLLHHVGCHTKAIASFACLGSCLSYVQMSTSKLWQNERSCSCCQETSLQEAIFTLDCPLLDPPYRKVKTYSPKDCMCRGCTNLEEENPKLLEFSEMLTDETG